MVAAGKKLLELYRAADADTKKEAMKLLRGEAGTGDVLESIIACILAVTNTLTG